MLGSTSGNGQRDVAALQQQLNVQDQQLRTLAGTLQHYRYVEVLRGILYSICCMVEVCLPPTRG